MQNTTTVKSVTMMCALVVRGAFDAAIVPDFESATGTRIAVEWLPTTIIMKKVAEGARADVLLVLNEAMDQLVADGIVEPESRVEVTRSRYGLAVRAGAPHPKIDTVEALTRTLSEARSVAFSKSGASGIYFQGLLPKLGIEGVVTAKATAIPAGFTAEKLVTGEADLAVQQISELMVVPGIEVIGAFPDPVQQMTTFSAAIMRDAENRDGAARFLAALIDPRAAEAYRNSGLEAILA